MLLPRSQQLLQHHHHQQHQQQQHHHGSSGGALAAAACRRPRVRPAARQNVQRVQALHIDRRAHLELAWRRQKEREDRLAADLAASYGKVIDVQDLEHLDCILDKAGSSLVVVLLYTRSCGVCKALRQDFSLLAQEAAAAKVRAVFGSHNLLDEFDSWSDVSRLHKIRVVPTVLFYDEGAAVKKLTLHDVRRMGEKAPSIRAAMQADIAALKAIFRQTVFEKAPGSRS